MGLGRSPPLCRAEGPHLAQLLPAAPKFRLRRVTLPLATNLGFCPAVADGGVAKGICLCLAECLECLCIKAVLSAAGSGWIGCAERLGGKEAGLAAIPEARTVHAIGNRSAQTLHTLGDSSTGVQHRRGLLLQTQGGRTRRWHWTGRRQQLDRSVSGSRVGPDTDQSSSATLARWAKGPAAGCGSC